MRRPWRTATTSSGPRPDRFRVARRVGALEDQGLPAGSTPWALSAAVGTAARVGCRRRRGEAAVRTDRGVGRDERRPVREPALLEAFARVWRHLAVEDAVEAGGADAIFCFGSRYWRVPVRAADLYAAGVAPVVLVTGAASGDEGPTEADSIGADLVARGVPAEAILLEPRARNTRENVGLGMDVLRRRGPVRRLVAVSWPLASRRCLATFARVEPRVEVLSAPALPVPGVPWWPTPWRIRSALGEVDRLDQYGATGHLVAPARPDGWEEAVAVLRRSTGG